MKTELIEIDPPMKRPRSTLPMIYSPATDAEAKALIKELDHYVWETFKVSGRFVENPYSLGAVIKDRHVLINLPGRRGTVLTWLLHERDSRELARAINSDVRHEERFS